MAVNMTGHARKKLLVIGKSPDTLGRKYYEELCVEYEAQRQCCLNTAMFENYLRKWNGKLVQKQQKVLLILEQNAAHLQYPALTAIELAFLPPNTSSILQPMQQGIIKYLKAHYRHLFLLEYLPEMQENQAISLSQALLLLSKAWQRLNCVTISNCFVKCGLTAGREECSDAEEENLLQQYAINFQKFSAHANFVEFLYMQENIQTITKRTDGVKNETLVEAVYSDSEALTDESKTETTLECALKAAETLKNYFAANYMRGEQLTNALSIIDETLEQQMNVSKLKQVIKKEPELILP